LTEPELAKTYCDGCGAITKIDSTRSVLDVIPNNEVAWEDVYERDARGHIVRKPETEVAALYPDAQFVALDALKAQAPQAAAVERQVHS
jgi:hypothetical protein